MTDDRSAESELDVTVVIISYNSEGRIGEAVRAHEQALTHLASEVIVVDNASKDASLTEARSAIERGFVIANEENVGYGRAANQGIVAARGKACLILNDDARLEPGAIDRLLDVLFAGPDRGLVGPRIVDEEGRPMPAARTTYPGAAEEWLRLRSLVRGENLNVIYPAGEAPMEVAWLVAACVLGKTDILRKTGGFNPEFFLYSEDIDLARRLTNQGYRVLTVPDAVCVHTGSVSTGSEFGRSASIDRRAAARDVYYRIWQHRVSRALIHLRRAIGVSNQPGRLRHHLPKVVWDGPSLRHLRVLDPLPASLESDDDDGPGW